MGTRDLGIKTVLFPDNSHNIACCNKTGGSIDAGAVNHACHQGVIMENFYCVYMFPGIMKTQMGHSALENTEVFC